ncbi:sphingomyelin synthase [Tyrophagus putrescentiae]|nr:sphingomyelin synthase [Tyrophagus putrescentiae]
MTQNCPVSKAEHSASLRRFGWLYLFTVSTVTSTTTATTTILSITLTLNLTTITTTTTITSNILSQCPFPIIEDIALGRTQVCSAIVFHIAANWAALPPFKVCNSIELHSVHHRSKSAPAAAVHVQTLDAEQLVMAGSDPAESVTIYHDGQSRAEKSQLAAALTHCQVDMPEDGLDEGTPIHPAGEPPTSSSASPLSITKTIRQLLVAACFLVFAVFFNLTVLAVIHERVPMGQPPLPDVAFALMPKNDHALDIAEYIIMFMTASTLVMTLLHRFRSIVLRRVLFILAILYLLRAVTMSITTLPVANPQYYCSPQLNMTDHFEWWNFTKTIVSRVSHMSLGMGLSVNGRHSFCGDYIFSGHTIMLVITYLFLSEYWLNSRLRRLHWRLVKYSYLMLVCVAIVCILVARGHYSVDIVIAYILASRVFFIYHCASDSAQKNTDISRGTEYVVENVFDVAELFPVRLWKKR